MARRRRIYFSSETTHVEEELPNQDVKETQSFQIEDRVDSENSFNFTDEIEERRSYREDQRENNGRLTNRLIQIISNQDDSRMVGVFGMNSDEAVLQSLQNIQDRSFSVDIEYINMSNSWGDVYDCIASYMLVKLKEKIGREDIIIKKLKQL